VIHRAVVGDIQARLRIVEDERSALGWLVPELQTVLGASGGGSYRMQRTAASLRQSSGAFGGRDVVAVVWGIESR
jgi:hypothetical protein